MRNEIADNQTRAPGMPGEQQKTPHDVNGREGSLGASGMAALGVKVAPTSAPVKADIFADTFGAGGYMDRLTAPALVREPRIIARRLRELAGISQAELARAYFGKTRSVVTHYETGREPVQSAYLQGVISASTVCAVIPFELHQRTVPNDDGAPVNRYPHAFALWADKLKARGMADLADVVRDFGAALAADAVIHRWWLHQVANGAVAHARGGSIDASLYQCAVRCREYAYNQARDRAAKYAATAPGQRPPLVGHKAGAL